MNLDQERREMVERQLKARDIHDERVLQAFRDVPRHLFVPEDKRSMAYADSALATMEGQTISQPYMVALMTQLLKLPADRTLTVLEIGTGSGYQAAIIAALGHSVVTVERREHLTEFARQNLDRAGYGERVTAVVSDGSMGWPAAAPYERILVTAGAPDIPHELTEQLAPGGRLVIPTGPRSVQQLKVIDKEPDGALKTRDSIACCFVPLIGKSGF